MGRVSLHFYLGVFAGLMTFSAHAEMASELEPDYAEAVLAFNSREYDRALKILTELQKRSPKTIEFMELQAVTLKASNRTDAAANVYRDLVQLKMKTGNNKQEIAPYAFELGVLRFNEKKFQQSEQYLDYSLRNHFNPEASNLYLGLIGIQTQNWDRAEKHLRLVTLSQLDELRAVAHFYLGQVYFQRQISANGFGELITARKIAREYLSRTDITAETRLMSEQIVKGVDTALAPFDHSHKFATLAFTAGYDSNVLLAPNESDAAAAETTEATMKATFSGHAGIATSPTKRFQYVPSFRFSGNRNFNRSTASGEFTETGLSLFVNRNPIAPVSFGVKVDTAMVFQNEYNQTTDESKYRLYTFTNGLAPYIRYDRHPRWTFTGELKGDYVKFNGDADLTESFRRNGPVYGLQAILQRKGTHRYINPAFTLGVDRTQTAGTEFRSLGVSGAFINTFRHNEYQFMQQLKLARTTFSDSSTDRGDTLIGILVSGHRKIGTNWAVLSSLDYTRNRSSDADAYSYHRFVLNAGLSYVF